jgi:hypothetical protein
VEHIVVRVPVVVIVAVTMIVIVAVIVIVRRAFGLLRRIRGFGDFCRWRVGRS